jgi:hypothetical protein
LKVPHRNELSQSRAVTTDKEHNTFDTVYLRFRGSRKNGDKEAGDGESDTAA